MNKAIRLCAGLWPLVILGAACAVGWPAQSVYILPYPVGAAYEVARDYCGSGPWSSHNNRLEIHMGEPMKKYHASWLAVFMTAVPLAASQPSGTSRRKGSE